MRIVRKVLCLAIPVVMTVICASAHAGKPDPKAVPGKTAILFTVHAPDRNGRKVMDSPKAEKETMGL